MAVSQCGVKQHEDDCLCDVKPLGSLMVSKNAVHDMWLGERIAEILDYVGEHKWDNESIIKYLETLTYVHDIWAEYGGVYYPTELDIKPLRFPALDRPWSNLQKWKLIRDSVTAAAHQHPQMSIITILSRLEITLEQFIVAVTANRYKHILTEDEFKEFNRVMVETKKPNYANIARVFGTGKTTTRYWKQLFRVSRDIKMSNNGKV